MAEDSRTIYFLTECKKETGYGHLSRCLSLHDAFQEENIQTQFIIDSDGSFEFRNAGIDPLILDWKANLNILKININKKSIIIIDTYQASKDQLKKLTEYFTNPVFVSDSKMNYYPKGMVIIGNSFATELNLEGTNKAKFLLGPEYILLRKEFWDMQKKLINPTINSILITLGGGGIESISEVVAAEVHHQFPDYNITIITTQKKNLPDSKKIQHIHKVLNAREMVELMIAHDIIICNGGQTLNECVRTGTPSISIEIANNQHRNIKSWTRYNVSLGISDNRNVKSISEQVIKNIQQLQQQSVREKINALSLKYIDGQGARNTSKEILNYFKLEK